MALTRYERQVRRRVAIATAAVTAVAMFLTHAFDMMTPQATASFPLSAVRATAHGVVSFYLNFYDIFLSMTIGILLSKLTSRLPKRWWITLAVWGSAWFLFTPVISLFATIADAAGQAVHGWWIIVALDWLVMLPGLVLTWTLVEVMVLLGLDFLISPGRVWRECRSLFARGKHRRRRFA